MLDSVTIEPTSQAVGSVIWLHGLGADGNDFAPVARQLNALGNTPLRFRLPHAPARPVTLNGGMVMPAWFDILGIRMDSEEDSEGIMASVRSVKALVMDEIERGVPPNKIFLAGFSQGGALALSVMLQSNIVFGGVLALSCYLPQSRTYSVEKAYKNRNTPLFMAHGTSDDVLPVSLGELSRDRLLELGFGVVWRTYPIAHGVSDAEVGDIHAWLAKSLNGSVG